MSRRNRLTLAVWTVAALTFALVASPGRATPQRLDMAPVSLTSEQGYNPGPIEPTTIQMVTETVTLDVDAAMTFTPVNEPDFARQLPGAAVTADFRLRNPEGTAQTLNVGFPMLPPPAFGTESYEVGLIYALTNLHAYVNGVEAPTTEASVAGQPWRVWSMTFAPGDTLVRVTYWQPVLGAFDHAATVELGYVLQTGAAWAGAIEQADLIANFPYPVETLFLEDGQSGFVIDGTSIRWHFDGLEPTPDNDLRLRMVSPSQWVQILGDRSALQSDPSADTYASLAFTTSAIVYSGQGRPIESGREPDFRNRALAQVSEAMFRKALELNPDDDIVRSSFADFLSAAGGVLLPESRLVEAAVEYQRLVRSNPEDGWTRWHYEGLLDTAGTAVPDSFRAQATQDAAALSGAATDLPTVEATQSEVPATVTRSATGTARPDASATTQALSPTSIAEVGGPTNPTPTPQASSAIGSALVPAGLMGIGLIACFLGVFALAVGGIWLLTHRKPRA